VLRQTPVEKRFRTACVAKNAVMHKAAFLTMWEGVILGLRGTQ
jgi:hypothetical protein